MLQKLTFEIKSKPKSHFGKSAISLLQQIKNKKYKYLFQVNNDFLTTLIDFKNFKMDFYRIKLVRD